MIPGPALRKECPYCKAVKELMSLRSGNTFGWTEMSELREVFYFLSDAKTLPAGEDPYRKLMEQLFDELDSESV